MAPMWSSWPWVMTKPLTLSMFSFRYVTSGMTRSIPSMSSSGNASPQSTTMILSSYSKTVMFIPICSRPPSGIIFNLLPLPVLDGGQVVITLLEWITNRQFSTKIKTAIMIACWVLLIGLMVFVTWNDIARLIGG